MLCGEGVLGTFDLVGGSQLEVPSCHIQEYFIVLKFLKFFNFNVLFWRVVLGPIELWNKTTCRLDPLDETLRTPPKKGHFDPPGPDPPKTPKKGGFAVLYQPLKSISRWKKPLSDVPFSYP